MKQKNTFNYYAKYHLLISSIIIAAYLTDYFNQDELVYCRTGVN